jgi:hypothetical protein
MKHDEAMKITIELELTKNGVWVTEVREIKGEVVRHPIVFWTNVLLEKHPEYIKQAGDIFGAQIKIT